MALKRALVTGSPDRVAALSKLFERAGDEPVTLAQLGPGAGAIDRYVQLGVNVPARGETVVRRVQSFLNDGLLERFSAVERVLPLLSDGATVLLVAGNVSAEAAAPDDRAARLLLLRVLGHAIRADLAPNRVRVRVISGERTDEDIVDFALSGAKDPLTDVPRVPDIQLSDTSYEDWRTQVMGLAQVEL
jgi:hypothetical protein